MKKILCSALTSLALVAGIPGFAQTAAPAAASAPAIDPATLLAARDLLAGLHTGEKLRAEMAHLSQPLPDTAMSANVEMVRRIAARSVHADPKLNATQKKDALAKVEKNMPEVMHAVQSTFSDPKLADWIIGEAMGQIASLYARLFTAPEIDQLAGYYATPVGVKVLADVPITAAAEIDQSKAFEASPIAEKMRNVAPEIMYESMSIVEQVMVPSIARVIAQFAEAPTN
ncbi:DUF2059 domain-containing protein [Janthinobacterium sp.]|uniref:DUF2059 domain-containing protein n=1 Tax=Janthinobacterium sp. TaxID=1871054 RepID=UPI00293D4812|nr:DUF2059 domain-containing protein [Janthinobacterium sp.]